MKNKAAVLTCLTVLFVLESCGEVAFRTVDCKAFMLAEEQYWSPGNIGDSVVFVNSSEERKKFVVVDKSIYHRPEYTTDTGCGCLDVSGMLLTSGTDSLWFKKELRYVKEEEGTRTEDVVFVLDDVQSVFYETHSVMMDTFVIGSHSFSKVKKFEYAYTEESQVRKVYLAKNLGILRFEMVDGALWTNTNLTEFISSGQDSFSYTEIGCE